VDIGGGSTEVARAVGEAPTDLWSVPLGAVRLTQIFDTRGRVPAERLAALRAYAAEEFREAIPEPPRNVRRALGSSGTIGAVVEYAAEHGRNASRREVSRAVEELAAMSLQERAREFDPRRAEIVVAGAVILEAAVRHLGLAAMVAVDRGLRDGILVELSRDGSARNASGAEAALELGRRFAFDEAHARQVASLALDIHDRLAPIHRLPASLRRVLEAAALLHDVGHAVSVHGHHKHTYYLVANADLPGFSDRERTLVALVARYHRRSAPNRGRADLEDLSASELAAVRKLTAILRVADALDRSHHQPVSSVTASLRDGAVRLAIDARAPIDLELWDAEREAVLFRRVFSRRLILAPASRAAHPRARRRS
jgi:exopolyphosphatase/guanosine-5'-triphosphate,3'-diphosphate pyrophosphatase